MILDWQSWRIMMLDLLSDLSERPPETIEAHDRLALAAALARTDDLVMGSDALLNAFFIYACGLTCGQPSNEGTARALLFRRLGAAHNGARSYYTRVH